MFRRQKSQQNKSQKIYLVFVFKYVYIPLKAEDFSFQCSLIYFCLIHETIVKTNFLAHLMVFLK